MLCRHCRKAPATRPRGLCWTCYDQPGIRDLYAVKWRFVAPVIRDSYGSRPLPPEPTNARPGSREKVRILHQRALLRCQLWHPRDAPMDEESRRLGIR